MPALWRVLVRRRGRHLLPYVRVRLNHPSLFPIDLDVVLNPSEPGSCVIPRVAELITNATAVAGGRRLVPAVDGSLIVRTLRLPSLAIPALSGGSFVMAPFTVAVRHAPLAQGAGGSLGLDFFGRFAQITYVLGPPDLLLLEEP